MSEPNTNYQLFRITLPDEPSELEPRHHTDYTAYLRMPTPEGTYARAVMRHDSTCSRCGKRFAAGDAIFTELAMPPAEGSWHHGDCANPTGQ